MNGPGAGTVSASALSPLCGQRLTQADEILKSLPSAPRAAAVVHTLSAISENLRPAGVSDLAAPPLPCLLLWGRGAEPGAGEARPSPKWISLRAGPESLALLS